MSAGQAEFVAAGLKLVELGTDLSEGRIADAVKAGNDLMDILVMMIPPEDLKQFLTDYDRKIADLTADVYEDIKLDGKEP